jgi:hypothetical protein
LAGTIVTAGASINASEPSRRPSVAERVTLQSRRHLRVRDGKIVEHWLSMDQLGFMQQRCVIPA